MPEISSRDILRKIIKGDIDSLNSFVSSGINLGEITEKENWTYLHRALVSPTLTPNIEGVEFLLKNGIDVNAIDIYGNSALHYAARSKNTEATKLIIKHGAKLDTLNNEGISPVHQSIIAKPYSLECTESMLQAGAKATDIMEYVKTISHGEDSYLEELFVKYQ